MTRINCGMDTCTEAKSNVTYYGFAFTCLGSYIFLFTSCSTYTYIVCLQKPYTSNHLEMVLITMDGLWVYKVPKCLSCRIIHSFINIISAYFGYYQPGRVNERIAGQVADGNHIQCSPLSPFLYKNIGYQVENNGTSVLYQQCCNWCFIIAIALRTASNAASK